MVKSHSEEEIRTRGCGADLCQMVEPRERDVGEVRVLRVRRSVKMKAI